MGQFASALPMFPGDWEFDAQITGCPGWPLTICLHSSGRPIDGAFQRNLLSLAEVQQATMRSPPT